MLNCGAAYVLVPPEVGKVGLDSPSFVQPIEERKDGIKALFAKQQQPAESGIPTMFPAKRQRSPTPGSLDSPAKRMKKEAPQIGESSSGLSPKKPRPPASPKKQSPSKKSKSQATGTSSITNFFPITSPRKAEATEGAKPGL